MKEMDLESTITQMAIPMKGTGTSIRDTVEGRIRMQQLVRSIKVFYRT